MANPLRAEQNALRASTGYGRALTLEPVACVYALRIADETLTVKRAHEICLEAAKLLNRGRPDSFGWHMDAFVANWMVP